MTAIKMVDLNNGTKPQSKNYIYIMCYMKKPVNTGINYWFSVEYVLIKKPGTKQHKLKLLVLRILCAKQKARYQSTKI